MGIGQGLRMHTYVSSVSPSPTHPHTSLTLHKILLIPTITKNLISVKHFCRNNNVQFLFLIDKCLVQSQVSKVALLEGHVDMDGLYEFPPITLSGQKIQFLISSSSMLHRKSDSSINSVCFNSSTYNMWHLRLGYPNHHALKLVLQ